MSKKGVSKKPQETFCVRSSDGPLEAEGHGFFSVSIIAGSTVQYKAP